MPDRMRYENARKPQGDYGRDLLDQMNTGTHARLATWGFSQMERFVGLPAIDARSLDVGCGGGANLMRLMALSPDGHATGVDYSAISVEKSRATCADAIAAGHCVVEQGDVSALPFAGGSFDVATAFETVYFWPSLVGGLAEIARALAPGGTLMICNETDRTSEADRWDGAAEVADLLTVYSVDQLEDALREAGLTPAGHARHDTEEWVVVFARKA